MNDIPPLPPLQPFEEFEAATVRELGPGAAKPTVGARHRKVNGGEPPSKRIDVTMGSNITPEPISFAWAGWLAYGKLHINAGRPGSMKTTTAMDWAATFTRGGQWPDGSRA